VTLAQNFSMNKFGTTIEETPTNEKTPNSYSNKSILKGLLEIGK
jgi:hypothetical protein